MPDDMPRSGNTLFQGGDKPLLKLTGITSIPPIWRVEMSVIERGRLAA
jgi:hypothetical protein